MKLRQITTLCLSILVLAIALVLGTHQKSNKVSDIIIDVSWPNCKAAPTTASSHGIIGVSGGLDFRPNKCLTQEVGWFNHYELYENTGYPGNNYGRKFQNFPLKCGATDSDCLAYNYGYNASLYALNYAAKQGIHASTWWLDVETDNSWVNDTGVNIASLEGSVAALKHDIFIFRIGFYSYPGQWAALTNDWRNNLPAWIATGQTVKNSAVKACRSESFTGGPILYSQYTTKLDTDIDCQGIER